MRMNFELWVLRYESWAIQTGPESPRLNQGYLHYAKGKGLKAFPNEAQKLEWKPLLNLENQEPNLKEKKRRKPNQRWNQGFINGEIDVKTGQENREIALTRLWYHIEFRDWAMKGKCLIDLHWCVMSVFINLTVRIN